MQARPLTELCLVCQGLGLAQAPIQLHFQKEFKGGPEMKRWKRRIRKKKLVERRKHTRSRVHTGIFAALSPRFCAACQIVDISRGGLAFRYVVSQQRSNQPCKRSILLPDGSSCLDDVALKDIWDSSIPYDFSFGAVTFGVCGVQFKELTDNQKSCLDHLIRDRTTGEVRVEPSVHIKVAGRDRPAIPAY